MATSLESLLKKLIAWAQEQPEIIALYLYGSHAERRANALSDVDLAVLARDDLTSGQLWHLEDRCIAEWPEVVDIRVLNLAPLPFRYEVTAKGRRVWAVDSGKAAISESLIWRQYWDLHPQLERDWKEYVGQVMEQKDDLERQQYEAALAKVRAVHRRIRETASCYADRSQE